MLAYRQQILAFLRDLISIPTSNPPGENYRKCAGYLSRKLSEWKIPHRLIAGPDEDYSRFFIVGSFGSGESLLHFHGHYDVVPASSPGQFKPCLKRDRLYGRGSSDMKGGLASVLFAIRLIKESGILLDGKITFSIVPDEETGGILGTEYLLNKSLIPRPRLGMLMPEPTSGVVWMANKGALTLKITIKGKSAHVGLAHHGINAFEQMVEVVSSLMKLKRAVEKRRTELPVTPPEAGRSVMLIGGKSECGFNFNVVPERAFFTVDRRINPEENLAQARKEIQGILDRHGRRCMKLRVEVLQRGKSSRAPAKSELAHALKESIEAATGRIPRFELCPGLCEIRFFNNRGIPAYAYGPGLLEVSHGPKEYVRMADVLKCAEIYALTVFHLLK